MVQEYLEMPLMRVWGSRLPSVRCPCRREERPMPRGAPFGLLIFDKGARWYKDANVCLVELHY